MLSIVRRDDDGLRRYTHLGTGNYHLGNTRAYTDFGLLTCDDAIGEDMHTIFQQLTGLGSAGKLSALLQSPFTLHETMMMCIERETQNAREGKPAAIRARMNALIEPRVIRALYSASRAGVPIDLLVRGVCCLRPGIPGVSENIRVRSVIGRFLEHSRVFEFANAGKPVAYASSADWMPRNFFRRVETAFPVPDGPVHERVVEEGLSLYFRDNTQAWLLQTDSTYVRVERGEEPPHCAQEALMARLGKG
jgi:polyphosphate kinase